MTTLMRDLAELIALEEKQAATISFAAHIETIKDRPDAPLRGRIYSAALILAGAEAFSELEGPLEAARQLRRIADRIECQSLQQA